MTKFITATGIFVFVWSFSLPVFSMPAIGDRALYDYVQPGTGEHGTYEIVLTEINKAKKKIKEKITITDEAGSSTNEYWSNASSYTTDAQILEIMTHCTEKRGKLEELSTPAGTFKTCLLFKEDKVGSSNIWYGQVPFGEVKSDGILKETNTRSIFVLKAFRFGQRYLD